MVKSNRSFIVYKRDGSEILIDEGRKIMETFGTISSIEVIDDDMRERMDLPASVLVEYSSFSSEHTLNMAAALFPTHFIDMFDVRKRAARNNIDRDTDFLRQYDLDRRSVYVGGLPLTATEQEIFELFSEVGEVIKVNMVQRHSQDGALLRQFCFVEFDKIDTPAHAIATLDGTLIRGWNITVQRKQSKVAKTPLASRYIGKIEPAEHSQVHAFRDAQAAPRPHSFTGQIYNGPGSTLNALVAYNNSSSAYDQGYQSHHHMATHHHEAQQYQRYEPVSPPMPFIPGNGAAVGMSGMPVHPASVSPNFGHSFPVHPPGHTPPGMMSAWPVITNTPTRRQAMGPVAHYNGMGPGAHFNPAFGQAQMAAPDRSRAQVRRRSARHFYQPADADAVEE
ncbi:hypothetical protein QBC41DRAFT_106225 [Cercophora samala]|uniref:RRM domain-containing protein n=1 Tax=Cercophora samala TaxID=330535 RepID=A0AA39ZFC4_9PEZI|nr:hypothetical protein QBC41DRAFT_106225 [Cercophora samala]